MRTSLGCGGLGYVIGAGVATALVVALDMAVGMRAATEVEPRGGDTIFKIAWSAAVFGIGPLVAVAVTLAIGRRLEREALAVAVVVALALYALTAWAAATPLTVMNDCGLGVKWPVTSIHGCD